MANTRISASPSATSTLRGTLSSQGTPSPQATPTPTPKTVRLNFRDMTGFELAVQFKAHSTFKKAMDVFSTRTQRSFQSLRFHYDGERLTSESTPAEFDMEDGDIIEVFTEQLGG